jgi:hypothetical protein
MESKFLAAVESFVRNLGESSGPVYMKGTSHLVTKADINGIAGAVRMSLLALELGNDHTSIWIRRRDIWEAGIARIIMRVA